ncbi:MAG: arsenite methyltransferase [Acidimicrobiales bacterium]|jgi:SAM-dependent methyltransferase
MTDYDVKEIVKERYGQAARHVLSTPDHCCGAPTDAVCGNLYDDAEAAAVPVQALQASLGCGNPTELAELMPGEVVLDLGSGGGMDVLLSARRVGPTGKVLGLDMTDEMLALAEQNKQRSGLTNVEFLRGEIESIPLPDGTVDVVISNCVINLSADKDRVLHEAFRVLRPAGRFAVSDLVVRGSIPAELRARAELWAGCLAGAMEETEYRAKLTAAGFTDIDVQPTRVFDRDEAHAFLADQGIDADRITALVDGKVMSAFIRAKKPA